MTKYLLEPKKNISLIEQFDGILIGLKDYSVGYEMEMTIEELKAFQKEYPQKELFVVFNKNIMNEELEEVEKLLKKLETFQVQGVLFYDLAILSICQKSKLNLPLVWNQTHMVTNYNTCNYYYNEGCKYAYLSSEITLDEMLEIIEKTKIKTMVKIFGHSAMAHSKRKLLSNYFKHIQKEKKKDRYKIQEIHLDKEYIVKEDSIGTTVFDGALVNGIRPSFSLMNQVDYLILEEQENFFRETIDVFHKVREKSITEKTAISTLNNFYPNSTEGFFYTKTIYKVKKDEES